MPDDRIPVADGESAPLDEEVEIDQRMENEEKAQELGLALARRVAFVFGEQPWEVADQHGRPAVVEVSRALQRRVDERGDLAQQRRRENGGQKGVAEIIELERPGQVRQGDGFGLDDDEKQGDSGERHRKGVQLAGVAQALDHRLGVGPLHGVAGRVEAHEGRRVGRRRVEAVDADLAPRDAVVARGKIDGAAAQVHAIEPRAQKVGSAKIGPAQIRAGELRFRKRRAGEVGLRKIDAFQVGGAEIGLAEVGPDFRLRFAPVVPTADSGPEPVEMFLFSHATCGKSICYDRSSFAGGRLRSFEPGENGVEKRGAADHLRVGLIDAHVAFFPPDLQAELAGRFGDDGDLARKVGFAVDNRRTHHALNVADVVAYAELDDAVVDAVALLVEVVVAGVVQRHGEVAAVVGAIDQRIVRVFAALFHHLVIPDRADDRAIEVTFVVARLVVAPDLRHHHFGPDPLVGVVVVVVIRAFDRAEHLFRLGHVGRGGAVPEVEPGGFGDGEMGFVVPGVSVGLEWLGEEKRRDGGDS